MLAAFLSTFCFAFSIICASRSVRANGTRAANIGRLVLATAVLGLFAHTLGTGFASASTPWLILSGVIGIGLGDLAVFATLPLIGARLSVLITQCIAAICGAFVDWLWLGTELTGRQLLWDAVILGGVALALMPSKANPPRVKVQPIGFLIALAAGILQGLGAIISRKGNFVALAAGEPAINGITAAYHRIGAGLIVIALYFAVLALLRKPVAPAIQPERGGWKWTVANGLAGPVVAISFYQWALAHTPAGIVLPIVAATPIVAIPLAYWLEGDRPSKRSVAGGLIAVGGCVALSLAR